MPKKILFRRLVPVLTLSMGCAITAHAGTVQDRDTCCQSQASDAAVMARRVKSAQDILDEIHSLNSNVQAFHEHSAVLIAQSKRLQGEAEVLQTKTPVLPAFAKLTPAQYQAALKQYNGDLHDFAAHAGAYDQHFKQFQATVGECHANEHALNDVLKKYEIHADQFHFNNLPATLRPPHICGRLDAAMGGMSQEANSMMMDQKKVLEAQLELVKTEANLQNAETAAAGTHTKAVNEAKREVGEQALAGEFSKLKDEYDLLKIEKERIAGNNTSLGKVSRASVSAKVKKN